MAEEPVTAWERDFLAQRNTVAEDGYSMSTDLPDAEREKLAEALWVAE